MFDSPYKIVTQIIGYAAMEVMCSAYAMRKRTPLLIVKIASEVLWIVHFSMMGALSAALINALAICREIVFSIDKRWAKSRWWEVAFIAAAVVISLTSWQAEGWVVILSCGAIIIEIFALYDKNIIRLRAIFLLSIPPWLVYGVLMKTYAAMIANSISAVILLINLICDVRAYKKNKAVLCPTDDVGSSGEQASEPPEPAEEN